MKRAMCLSVSTALAPHPILPGRYSVPEIRPGMDVFGKKNRENRARVLLLPTGCVLGSGVMALLEVFVDSVTICPIACNFVG